MARVVQVPVQITVSPCLPYSSIAQFGQRLLQSGAQRIIIDTAIDGDGTGGTRTARTAFARAEPAWSTTTPAQQLYAHLRQRASDFNLSVGWSNAGFCGIEPRSA